ncbi:hypothetical protein, partial [Bacillus sp. S1-R2T1-FB]|uniref:hypothetical protein n=1 Tax=Bacillus sp. S1-R2T1-FB TaxID=1973493 RepID=UPI001C4FA93A
MYNREEKKKKGEGRERREEERGEKRGRKREKRKRGEAEGEVAKGERSALGSQMGSGVMMQRSEGRNNTATRSQCNYA